MKYLLFIMVLALVPGRVISQECSQVYTFNITEKTSYTTSCGAIDETEWKVIQNSCNFYTPVLTAGGSPGDPGRPVSVSIRLSNSGNLDEKDFAWIFYYVNGKVEATKTIRGDEAHELVSFRDSLMVPAGGTFKMRLAMVCDEPGEFWKLNNGDLSVCVRAAEGERPVNADLPESRITCVKERNIVRLVWSSTSGPGGNYFKIERSRNGKEFEFAGYVKDTRNNVTVSRYSFIDSGCFKPETWYRITRIDLMGKETLYGKPTQVIF